MNGYKILRYIKRVINACKAIVLRATTQSLKPKYLWFGVNNICNNRCIFCDIWHNKSTENTLTVKEIEKIFNDNLFKDLELVMIAGGEPVLRDDLKEIILTIHKAVPKARIQLSTNGLLYERVLDVVKFAIKHEINIDVGISLDAINEKRDIIRGIKGSFEKVDRLLHELVAIRKKHSNRLTLVAGMILIDATLPLLKDVELYCQKLNVPLGLQWYSQTSYYNNEGKNLAADCQALAKIIQALPPSFNNEMKLKALNGKSIKFCCFAMYTFCILQYNGDITPCFNFWDVKVGNTRQNSPSEIWHSSEAKKTRKMVKNCQGCLNDCALEWSVESSPLVALSFPIKKSLGIIR